MVNTIDNRNWVGLYYCNDITLVVPREAPDRDTTLQSPSLWPHCKHRRQSSWLKYGCPSRETLTRWTKVSKSHFKVKVFNGQSIGFYCSMIITSLWYDLAFLLLRGWATKDKQSTLNFHYFHSFSNLGGDRRMQLTLQQPLPAGHVAFCCPRRWLGVWGPLLLPLQQPLPPYH